MFGSAFGAARSGLTAGFRSAGSRFGAGLRSANARLGPATTGFRAGMSSAGSKIGSSVSGFGRKVLLPLKVATYGLAIGGGALAGWKASRSRSSFTPSTYRSRRDPLAAATPRF